MSKNRYINTKFWDDTYIINLDPVEKLLFLYFLTNPLTSIAGVYEISLRRVAFDTGIDKDMVEKIVNRFSKDNKIIYIDGWVVIKNFVEHQAVNPKIERGIESIVQGLPEDIRIEYDRLSKASNYSNSNSNSNSNRKRKKKTGRFTPPSLEEIKKHMQLKGYNNFTAEQFFSFYESNGWKVGKNKMKSWQMALAGWEARKKGSDNKSNFFKT